MALDPVVVTAAISLIKVIEAQAANAEDLEEYIRFRRLLRKELVRQVNTLGPPLLTSDVDNGPVP